MAKSFVPWDSPDGAQHYGIVWWAKLDHRYLLEVRRTGPGTAKLLVFDHQKEDREIASWDVGLAYDAKFGPDVDDVMTWQEMAATFVDDQYDGK